MAQQGRASAEVNARIVYWGIEGSGKSTNLRVIHAKLRPDHRSALREIPTRLDPTCSYEVLPIELGEVGGVRTRMEIVTLPAGPEQAPTRKGLLDRADGVVFVIDAQRERIDENVAAFEELRRSLSAYGRPLEDVPLVLQYNKRDLADPYALEELHRKLDVRGAAVFEAVATDGTGVLQTLTTLSKRVIRSLRGGVHDAVAPPVRVPAPAPVPPLAPPAPSPLRTPAPAFIPAPTAVAPAPAPAPAPFAAAPSPLVAEPESLRARPLLDEIEPELEVVETELGEAEPELEVAEETSFDAPDELVYDDAIVLEHEHPDAAAIAVEAEAARVAFDDSWNEMTDPLRRAPDDAVAGTEAVADAQLEDAAPTTAFAATRAPLEIASVGQAERTGATSVRLPLVLRDGSGRELALSLSLSLEPLLEQATQGASAADPHELDPLALEERGF